MNSKDTGYGSYCIDDSDKSHSGSSLNYSTDINAISVDLAATSDDGLSTCSGGGGMKYLPRWPAANLEFRNLSYSVPEVNKGMKKILHNISGEFKSHTLTAIMGPSGAGKTTLLNILAGFGTSDYTGEINVNRCPRKIRLFRKMSRYIMQQDLVDPHFTVMETMMFATNLKLGNDITKEQKVEIIEDILNMLRLEKTANTLAARLSGGERKRLCIAVELVNNPPVLFLDEPTTGLDDLSSTQCISLLSRLAHGGRTIICSIHTPPAKLFQMFDKVYILAEGQCVYQGSVGNIVPYLKEIGPECPLTYNPADFIIEVACREYGDYHKQMVKAVDNGNIYRWESDCHCKHIKSASPTKSNTTSGASSLYLGEVQEFEVDFDKKMLTSKCSWWMQYKLLLAHMLTKMWRDKYYIKLKFYMNIVLALIVGGMYFGMGNDASKALFNFGFTFTIVIAYLYLPLMPVLVQFPSEMKLLKREYFNQWYRLSSYYVATITSKFPYMFILAFIYLTTIYLMSNQPLELFRFAMLFFVAILTAQVSDSLGMLITSRLSLLNGMFVGPVLAVPLILLSCYGIGSGKVQSAFMRMLMNFSFLRHSMEGLFEALYGYDRADTICPVTEVICVLKKAKYMRIALGFEDINYWASVCFLMFYFVLFSALAFVLIKRRLSPSKGPTNRVLQHVNQMLVKYCNFTSFNY